MCVWAHHSLAQMFFFSNAYRTHSFNRLKIVWLRVGLCISSSLVALSLHRHNWLTHNAQQNRSLPIETYCKHWSGRRQRRRRKKCANKVLCNRSTLLPLCDRFITKINSDVYLVSNAQRRPEKASPAEQKTRFVSLCHARNVDWNASSIAQLSPNRLFCSRSQCVRCLSHSGFES